MAAARKTSHRWTPETARTAALKSWRKKGRKSPFKGREGVRIGRKLHRAPPIDHAALRAYYAANPTRRIRYYPGVHQWRVACPCWTIVRVISERQAFILLGHLPCRYSRDLADSTLVRIVQREGHAQTTVAPDGTRIIEWR